MARHEKHGNGEGHGDDDRDTDEVVIMGGWMHGWLEGSGRVVGG